MDTLLRFLMSEFKSTVHSSHSLHYQCPDGGICYFFVYANPAKMTPPVLMLIARLEYILFIQIVIETNLFSYSSFSMVIFGNLPYLLEQFCSF